MRKNKVIVVVVYTDKFYFILFIKKVMRKTIRNQSMNCIKSKIIEFGVSDQKFFPNSRLKT